VPITLDNLPNDLAALKRIIAAMAQDALTAQAEIARLKFQLARYRRAEFGRSSEKLAREAEQLELALEAVESDQAERLATASPAVAAVIGTAAEAQKPARRALPQHLPREDLRHPAPCTCPSCGGALRKIADDVTETLDYVPGRFKVVRHTREKRSCRACDTVVAASASELAGGTLHVDDTPVPVLAPGTGKTKTGRLWTYVRDERPFGGSRKPAALFFYSPDRKGEHRQAHLKDFRGVIHADGYTGFNELFAGGRNVEAGCWAHVRRNSLTSTPPPAHRSPKKRSIASASSTRSRRSSTDHRPSDDDSSASGSQSRLPREALAPWAEGTVRRLSRKSQLAQAFHYMRARWTALVRCFDDGRLALDNNPAERALRCVAIGRKNYLFAGSDAGGRRAAALYSLIESAKLNGLNPQHYLADLLARIADHPARRITELLPWSWQPLDATCAAA